MIVFFDIQLLHSKFCEVREVIHFLVSRACEERYQVFPQKNGDLPEAKGGREEMFSKKIFPFQLTEYSTTDLVVSPIAVKRKSEYRTAQLAEFPPTLFTTKVVSPVARLMARKRNFPFERSHVGIGFLNTKPPAPLSISFSSSIQEVLEEWQVSPDSSFVGIIVGFLENFDKERVEN